MKPDRRLKLLRVLALITVIVISVYVYSIRDRAQELARYGYPGIFFLSILANATVILPAPSLLIVYTMGAIFDPVGVAIAAGAGAAIGELSGYLAGFSGQAVVENANYYLKLKDWMALHPTLSYLAILFLAFIPNPLFDLAGIAAGTLKIPVSRFLIFCGIGKTLKMLLFAYLGALTINQVFGSW